MGLVSLKLYNLFVLMIKGESSVRVFIIKIFVVSHELTILEEQLQVIRPDLPILILLLEPVLCKFRTGIKRILVPLSPLIIIMIPPIPQARQAHIGCSARGGSSMMMRVVLRRRVGLQDGRRGGHRGRWGDQRPAELV